MTSRLTKAIHAELLSIAESNDGIVRPADVVAFAADPATSLHAKFDWNDTVAGQKWRLEQARQIIRVSVSYVGSDEHEQKLPTFVSLGEDRMTPGGGYRHFGSVLQDDELRAEMLRTAQREFEAFRRRWQRLSELSQLWEAGDAAFAGLRREEVA